MQSEFTGQELKWQQGKWALLELHVLWKICSLHTETFLIFPPGRKRNKNSTGQLHRSVNRSRNNSWSDLPHICQFTTSYLIFQGLRGNGWCLGIQNLNLVVVFTTEINLEEWFEDKFSNMPVIFWMVSVISSRWQLWKSSQNDHIQAHN